MNEQIKVVNNLNENDVKKALTYCYQLLWNDLKLNGVLNEIIDRVEELS